MKQFSNFVPNFSKRRTFVNVSHHHMSVWFPCSSAVRSFWLLAGLGTSHTCSPDPQSFITSSAAWGPSTPPTWVRHVSTWAACVAAARRCPQTGCDCCSAAVLCNHFCILIVASVLHQLILDISGHLEVEIKRYNVLLLVQYSEAIGHMMLHTTSEEERIQTFRKVFMEDLTGSINHVCIYYLSVYVLKWAEWW